MTVRIGHIKRGIWTIESRDLKVELRKKIQCPVIFRYLEKI